LKHNEILKQVQDDSVNLQKEYFYGTMHLGKIKMHTYLKQKLPWYSQWHEQWIANHTHWLIFTCAILTATWLFSYVLHSAPGQAIVADVAPVVYAQVHPAVAAAYVDEGLIPHLPVVLDRVKK
jgi:hypothetical protein